MQKQYDIRDIILKDMQMDNDFPTAFLIGMTVKFENEHEAVIIECNFPNDLCILSIHKNHGLFKASLYEILSNKIDWNFDLAHLEKVYYEFTDQFTLYQAKIIRANLDVKQLERERIEFKKWGGLLKKLATSGQASTVTRVLH